MKKAFLLFVLAMVTMCTMSAQTPVDGKPFLSTIDTIVSGLPFPTHWSYGMSQQIYTANELDLPKSRLTKLRFYRFGSISSSITGQIEVYIGHTTKSSFTSASDYIAPNGLTKVYDGSVTWPLSSNLEITFQTPFIYDGESNLVLYVRNKTGSYNTNTIPSYYASKSRSTSCVLSYCDNGAVYPNPSLNPNGTNRLLENNRSVIAFTYEPFTPTVAHYDDETAINPVYTIDNATTLFTASKNYSWIEQIYTSTEMGGSRELNAVAFRHSSGSGTRRLEIYLGHTSLDKSSLTSYSWVPLDTMTLVFSGNVTVRSSDDWVRIDFDRIFHYNAQGGDNLVIAVRDVTGVANSNDHCTFYYDELNGVYVGAEDNTPMGYGNRPKYTSTLRAYSVNARLLTRFYTPGYQVGAATSNDTRPINPYYKYSCAQSIYTASEIGGAGFLRGISLMTASNFADNRNVEIYVGHTDLNSYSSVTPIPLENMVKVYGGITNFEGNARYTYFPFNQPFLYNGRQNLVVYVYDKTGVYDNNQRPTFAVEPTTTCRCIYDRADTRTCEPANWAMQTSNSRPVVLFDIKRGGVEIGSCAVSNRPGEPINDDYKYTVTQIIYTKEELGQQPVILNNIAFHQLSGNVTRSGYIYLSETDKSTFANNADWDPIDNYGKAHVGTFSFNKNDDWATVNFLYPFTYSGKKNLCVTILDYTNSANPGVDIYTPYFCEEAVAGKVLRAYCDTVQINPQNANRYASPAILPYRPIAKFGMSPVSACDLVITPNEPYSEDFQSGLIPSCWQVGSYQGGSAPGISNTTLPSDSATNYSLTLRGNDKYASTPLVLNPVKDTRLSFRVWKSNGNPNDLIVGVSEVQALSSSSAVSYRFVPLDTISDAANGQWTSYNLQLYNGGPQGNRYISFVTKGTSTTADYHIDDILIEDSEIVLPEFTSLYSIETGGSVRAVVNVDTHGKASKYELRLCNTPNANDYFWVNSNLTPNYIVRPSANLNFNTKYYVFIRIKLADNYYTDWVMQELVTVRQAVTLPVIEEFENSSSVAAKWGLNTYTGTNGWFVGTAAKSEGNQGLYISNNNGVSNQYSSTTTNATAILDVQMSNGTYNVEYAWRCKGEIYSSGTNAYDYFRVYLAPSTVSDATLQSFYGASTLPTGCIPLDNGSFLNSTIDTLWHKYTGSVDIATAGTYKLVILWHNDASVCNDPPVAIDHLFLGNTVARTINDSTCRNVPYTKYGFNVTTDEIQTGAMAVRTHRSNDTVYTLYLTLVDVKRTNVYANVCQTDLPYIWKGMSMTETGNFNAYLTAANGCDSIVTLHLTVNPNTKDTVYVSVTTADLPYTWRGQTYNAAGTYTVTEPGVVTPCPNYHTLVLTITDLPVRSLPYISDFENTVLDADWFFYNNSTSPNRSEWHIGSAVNNGGNRSLYISNDGGLTHTYDEASTTITMAVFPAHAAAGNYAISYDWLGLGESFYDYMRVYVVRASDFNASTLFGSVNHQSLPSYTIPVDNRYLNGHNTWQHEATIVNLPTTDDYYVVFHWQNDDDTYNDPPVAIDNFRFTAPIYSTVGVTHCNDEEFNRFGLHLSVEDLASLTGENYMTSTSNDTIYRVYLTVVEAKTTNLTQTVCSSDLPFSWNGQTITAAGTYTHNDLTVYGCDSIVTLTVNVNPVKASSETMTFCSSELPYSWHDYIITAEGTYTYTTTAANGCDSVVTLTVNVFPSYSNTWNVTRCSNELPYIWHGKTYNATSTDIWTSTTANGCDSVETLNFTVLPSTVDTVHINLNYGDSVLINGIYYHATGTQMVNYINASGCDSVVYYKLRTVPANQVTLPYVENFESVQSGDWAVVSTSTATAASKWYVGTAVNNGGTHALYVSNDNGVSNAYTSGGYRSSAVRYVHVPTTGNYDVAYDWRCYGEYNSGQTSFYDYFRVYLAPVTSTTLESINNWYSPTSMNANYISLDGIINHFGPANPNWEAFDDSVNIPAGDYFLVFLWRDDSSIAHNPPAAIDNFYLGQNLHRLTFNDNACTGSDYNGHGFSFTASQLVSGLHTYTRINGDSLITLNLTVSLRSETSQSMSLCPSELPYSWHGQNITAAGSYTWNGTAANGCDSIVTLNVTLKQPKASNESIAVCPSDLPYSWHGQNLTAAGNYTYTTTASNGCDSVVTLTFSVKQAKATTLTQSICPADIPYLWHGQNITTAGTYTWTGTAANGCDSVVTLNLTVSQAKTNTVNRAVCPSELPLSWNGQTITAAGSYTYNTVASNGCDSIVTLVVTLKQPKATSLTQTICPSDIPYSWHGQNITTAGTYTWTGTASNGCDSVVTLTLTISQAKSANVSLSVCPSELPYTWNGQSLTTAGTYTYNTVAANGCDSVVTLTFTVKQNKTTNVSYTACPSELPYSWNGQSLTTAGTYTYNTVAANGCDSVVTLTFAVGQTKTTNLSHAVCDNELPYLWNGQSLTAAGTYTYSTTAVNGCDSIVTLTLTVNATFQGTETLDLESTDLPYTWNGQTITAAGTYTYNGTTTAGCDSVITLTVTVTTVGLDYADDMLFRISPNPVKRGETVRIDAEVGESFVVELYTSESKLMNRFTAEASPLFITMPEVDGLYLVRLVTESGRVMYGKVIVK